MLPNQKPWCTGQLSAKTPQRTQFCLQIQRQRGCKSQSEERHQRCQSSSQEEDWDHFNNNKPRMAWQSIQQITSYRGNSSNAADGDTSQAEHLNCFSARFEVSNTNVGTIPPSPVCNNSHTLTVQEHEGRQMLSRVNPRNAAGLDGVTG